MQSQGSEEKQANYLRGGPCTWGVLQMVAHRPSIGLETDELWVELGPSSPHTFTAKTWMELSRSVQFPFWACTLDYRRSGTILGENLP